MVMPPIFAPVAILIDARETICQQGRDFDCTRSSGTVVLRLLCAVTYTVFEPARPSKLET